jgi:hypothetical protein
MRSWDTMRKACSINGDRQLGARLCLSALLREPGADRFISVIAVVPTRLVDASTRLSIARLPS